jgi:hypothetical protein
MRSCQIERALAVCERGGEQKVFLEIGTDASEDLAMDAREERIKRVNKNPPIDQDVRPKSTTGGDQPSTTPESK